MNNINYEQINYDQVGGVKPILTNLVHTRLHWHNELEMIFVCQGSVTLSIRGTQRQLHQGDIAVINSDEIHAVNSNIEESANSVFLLQISGRFLQGFHIDFETIRYEPIIPNSSAAREIRRTILLIINELQNKDTAYMVAIHGYCGYIIALLTRHFVQREYPLTDADQYQGNKSNIQRIKRIFDYIHQHYQENPSLKDIASVVFVSPYYLSHFFTATVGMTYSQYLNTIKIDMVQQDLIDTSDSIADIMMRHGFTSTKTFNRVFKNIAGRTPRAYRKNAMIQNTPNSPVFLNRRENLPPTPPKNPDARIGDYINFHSRIDIPQNLYREYADKTAEQSTAPIRVIRAGTEGPVKTLDRYYKKMISTARASDILRASIQEQLKSVQEDIHFEYIHFHGIFNDEMGVLPPGGRQDYNFTYIDDVFDFLLSIGLRPFVELSFMPSALAGGEETVFFYRGNITPPKDWSTWENLISSFMNHIIQRYTLEEIEHWYFEVWNEPNLKSFWTGTFDDYMELYRRAAKSIKAAGPSIPVGGPAISSFQYSEARSFLDRFLAECTRRKLPLDFISGHPYPAYYYDEGNIKKETFPGPEQSRNDILWIRGRVDSSAYSNAELFLDEYNNSSHSDDLLHDTAFMAPFLIQNYLSCQGLVQSLSYWALSDIFEESGVPGREFHGGFGLLNKSGLKKPQYYAFIYLNRLGGEILCQEKDYIITRRTKKNGEVEGIQILAWNYVHYDVPYANGDKTKLDYYDRYGIFEKKETISYRIIIPSAESRPCLIEKSQLDRGHGSIFDFWLKNGAIEYPSPGQLELLRTQCRPHREITIKQGSKTLALEAILPPHSFVFFDIQWLNEGVSKP